MLTFIWSVQIVSAFLLICLILLHSPKGDGIAGMGGSGQFASQKGAEKKLNKITAIVALIFFVCIFLLGF